MSRATDSPGIRFPPPLLFAALTVGAFAVDGALIWRLTAPSGAVAAAREALGVLVLACGLLLDLSALVSFLRARTNPLPFRPARSVVARGPYRLTRNPMYLGMTLTVTGLGLLVNVGWLLPAAVASGLLVDRWIIPREEAYLERRFGAVYLDYKRRVRRWI